MYRYLSKNGITNPIFLITGHSRGAAVANLLAETLNNQYGTTNVFAYTFATPNVTKNPNIFRWNIYNFCLFEDFVPQVPLSNWSYGKHGITSIESTILFDDKNQSFTTDMKPFIKESKGNNEVIFRLDDVKRVLAFIFNEWKTVDEYYNKDVEYSFKTLYSFFRNVVAPAAMDEALDKLEVFWTSLPISPFAPISSFFIKGASTYIYNAHHAFTYYTAMKYDLFTLPQYIL